MIYLLTGTPGSGKTLAAMELIEKWGKENPGRLIYSANIDGQCYPGVLPLDDAGVLEWHRHCEKDSLVVVDEAQRYWRASRGGDPSQAIIEMETHRHDGIDIVLMTQHPTFLHANIRKLVNVHIHLVAHTKSSALRYEWREAHDDVQDSALRMLGEFKEWKYPVHLYPFYKSATMHTKRAKRPWYQVKARIAGVVAVVMFAAVIGFGIYVFKHGDMLGPSVPKVEGKQVADAPAPVRQPPSDVKKPQTPAQYVEAQMPRIPSQPWSAPLYDGQQVTAHPQVYCVAKGDDSDCHCITEQGTRYVLALDICLTVAKYGPAYDPFKPERPRDDRKDNGSGGEGKGAKPIQAEVLPQVAALLPAGVPVPASATK